MAIKKVRERIHNGGTTGTEADYDVIHYETSEDLLVGQVQEFGDTGYRVLSGGLILIWGSVVIQNTGYVVETTVKLPITVKRMGFPVWGFYDTTAQVFANATNRTTTGFTLTVKSLAPASGNPSGIGAVRINYHIICEI